MGPNREQMQAQAALARKYGLQLIAYEGGPHLVGVGGAENNPALTALFHCRQPQPANGRNHPTPLRKLVRRRRRGLRGIRLRRSRRARSGSWGVLEFQDQPVADAPKYRAILDVLRK